MTVTVDTTAKLLVTGASGHLGQQVLTHLLDTLQVAPANIVAGSRDPSNPKLQAFAQRGVATRRLDFNDAASVEAAAQGVDRALLISGDDIFNRLDGQKTAVSALVAAGVKHILYTSLLNADKSTAHVAADHLATERFIQHESQSQSNSNSKLQGYTILRNGLYFENAIGSAAGAKHTGKWYSAAKDGKMAGIARDDLALANAAALASDNYDNQRYELCGPVGLTVDEIVADVSQAIGTPIEVVQVSVEALAQGIAAATGLPEAAAKVYASFDTATAEGHAEPSGSDFKALVGRDAISHREWVANNAALFKAL